MMEAEVKVIEFLDEYYFLYENKYADGQPYYGIGARFKSGVWFPLESFKYYRDKEKCKNDFIKYKERRK